jgi:mannosyl-3-phosphoglycerate phosphatase family protein
VKKPDETDTGGAPAVVVFTDLDGTLLDHATYRPGPAEAALHRLQDAGVAVVFCSAKTAAEQRPLRRRLGVADPFIVENGAAVHGLPRGPVVFGLSYQEIRGMLRQAAAAAGVRFRGYGDMSKAEISARTGLGRRSAALAARREHTETFVIEAGDIEALDDAAAARGLHIIRGARFFTAVGDHDKGTAVRWLLDHWGGSSRSIGIGDYVNDYDMLAAVDEPMIVQRPDGTWADLDMPGTVRLEGIGPAGWCLGADALLKGGTAR